LAHVLNCSRATATRLADSAALLTRLLPSTWEALSDGQLDWPRARALAAELLDPAREVAAEVIAAVEAAVLPRAGGLSITGLRAAARRELLRHDAAAANRRRREAERAADVTLRPARDGLATLASLGPAPLTTAIWQTIDSYARMAKADGDPRSLGQLRVGVLGDLVLRPWDTSRPPVTAHVTVVAPLAALESGVAGHDACAVGHPPSPDGTPDSCGRGEPADVNGEPITAAQLRKLLEQLDVLCPGGMQAPAGGTLNVALVDPVNGACAPRSPGPSWNDWSAAGARIIPGDGCACPVLDRPAPVDRYRPTPAHYRYVRTRDRTCRHPGCRNGAGWADLDHVVPHADGGPTDCANLCCLCRRVSVTRPACGNRRVVLRGSTTRHPSDGPAADRVRQSRGR
jgi:hypothetical protein